MGMNETSYKCPVCKGNLVSQPGSKTHPNDEKYGFTVFCPHLTCPAQEVMGHGKNDKEAFEVITDRFKGLV